MGRRIRYRNWVAELGVIPRRERSGVGRRNQVTFVALNPDSQDLSDEQVLGSLEERRRIGYIWEQVSLAIRQLSDDEREFVERFYFSGESFREISERTGREIYRLEAIQKRALRRLKKMLREFVSEVYGVKSTTAANCPICESGHRGEIDQLILSRDRSASWRPVMKEIFHRYGITIRTPMILIGHERYH